MEKKSNIEFYTWGEKVASELKKRKVKKHVVHGMWTPSGYFHIGNARPEVFTPAIAYEALLSAGLKAEFNLFFDDFDDFEGIPEGIKADRAKFKQYIGLPLKEVPSPDSKYSNWAEFFEQQIVGVIGEFGVRPNFLSSYDNYKQGKYDKAIKIVLENSDEVLGIWEEIVGKKPRGLPVMARCEKCKRTLTTLSTKYDGSYLHYSCEQEVKGMKGCGHKGKIKPEKGAAKLPWRLHWPATWFIFGTTFESGGKDHFTVGGSIDTGKAFAEKIFKIQPPLLVGTDFVTVDDKKMSGSLGNVISMADWLEFAEPELLRFLYVSSSPKKVINFDLKSSKFFFLADRYDRAERIYFGKLREKDKQEGEKTLEQAKRQYRASQIKLAKKMPAQLSYSYAVLIAQTRNITHEGEILATLKNFGYAALESDDKKRILNRIILAKNWLDKYAPEELKIVIVDRVDAKLKKDLNKIEKEAILDLNKVLKQDVTGDELQPQIYEISKKHGVEPKRFFELLYRIIINKPQGPKLGPFIVALGRERVAKLLAQV